MSLFACFYFFGFFFLTVPLFLFIFFFSLFLGTIPCFYIISHSDLIPHIALVHSKKPIENDGPIGPSVRPEATH